MAKRNGEREREREGRAQKLHSLIIPSSLGAYPGIYATCSLSGRRVYWSTGVRHTQAFPSTVPFLFLFHAFSLQPSAFSIQRENRFGKRFLRPRYRTVARNLGSLSASRTMSRSRLSPNLHAICTRVEKTVSTTLHHKIDTCISGGRLKKSFTAAVSRCILISHEGSSSHASTKGSSMYGASYRVVS